MRLIPLHNSKGEVVAHALIDDEDYPIVSGHSWHLSDKGYARCQVPLEGRQGTIRMHRLILGASPGEKVDHRNGDKLDNRRLNLRLCTTGQNTRNRPKLQNSLSPYKGIELRGKRWRSQLSIDGKRIRSPGTFADPADAAMYYDVLALRHHGEFAWTNF